MCILLTSVKCNYVVALPRGGGHPCAGDSSGPVLCAGMHTSRSRPKKALHPIRVCRLRELVWHIRGQTRAVEGPRHASRHCRDLRRESPRRSRSDCFTHSHRHHHHPHQRTRTRATTRRTFEISTSHTYPVPAATRDTNGCYAHRNREARGHGTRTHTHAVHTARATLTHIARHTHL